jgi:hypothetical protein
MLIGMDLLDRQIVDRDGEPVGKVDDVELDVDADGTPYVAALLVGQHALGQRIGGRLGSWIAGTARRLSPDYHRGPLPDPALESWLRDHLIGRIPGASDAS